MPDILTHTYAVKQAISRISNREIANQLRIHNDLLIMGAQGPDFLFYKDAWPWKDNKSTYALGSLLHKERTGDFFVQGLEYLLKTDQRSVSFTSALAYWLGWLSHYALDQSLHPYIYYHSGIPSNTSKEDGSSHNHKRFEAILDALLIKRVPFTRSQHDMLQPESIELTHAASLLEDVIPAVYNVPFDPSYLKTGFTDMKRILHVLYDPYHIKRPLVRVIERLTSSPNAYASALFSGQFPSGIDWGNEQGRTWYHPCDPETARTESFWFLLDQGISLTLSYWNCALDVLEEQAALNTFAQLIGNNHYDTGYPCTNPCTMVIDHTLFE